MTPARSPARDVGTIGEHVARGALALTLAGAFAFIGLFLGRYGLGDDPRAVGMLFALSILPICLSAAAMLRFGHSPLAAACALVLGFVLGLLLPLASFAWQTPVPALTLVVLAAALLGGKSALPRPFSAGPLCLLLMALLFAAVMVVFSAPTRLFMPETIALGQALSDNYYDIAIAQMLGHHGALSVGGDGLALHSYHFLSQLIAAGLSKTTSAPMTAVYLYWGSVSLKLQLLWAVFASGLLLAPPRATAFAGRLGFAGLTMLLVGALESESFLQGAALYAAALPLFLTLAGGGDNKAPPLPAIGLALIVVLLCAFAKISAGFFGGIALLIVLWRHRQHRMHSVLLVAGLLLLVPPTYILVLPKDLSMSGLPLRMLLADYYQNYFTLTTLLSYLLPMLVIALLVLRPQARPGDANVMISWNRTTLRDACRQSDAVTQLVALSLIACIVVLVTQPIGSNVGYFSLYVYLLALLLLPAALGRSNLALPQAVPSSIIAVMLGGMLAVGLVTFVIATPEQIAFLYKKASGGPAYTGHVMAEMRQSRHLTGTLFGTLHQRIAASPWEQLMNALTEQSRALNGQLIVEITPDAEEVWRRLEGGNTAWWCMAPHLMIPAETGLAQARSMAPETIEQECAPFGQVWYGFGKDQDRHRTSLFTDRERCTLARPIHARAVYLLKSYRDLSQNRLIRCEAG
jgi:hypothetical protein